ncbi:DUF4397 domain-containing protein [Roseibacillus ishigakijimensis]|uniref:DUF4397 domain-containing protein n=1 Tax=Roseibacillus ishigakijimensis TaxID=454146 RepID=A0A934RPK7_9BACT|nr:DUF4397 domain-containing protein [Roseibacillus ishigakijimensis]MBK1834640.1 DUF4397 domain-containing protein [Roseibacillus ishigakijimensis]
MKSKLTSFLLIVAGLFATASAQDAPQVSMQLDLVAWGNELRGLSLGGPEKGQKHTAKPFQYSEPVRYTGNQLLEIHQIDTGADEAPEMSEEDARHATIPLSSTNPEENLRSLAESNDPLVKALLVRREEEPTLVALVQLPANTSRATVLLAPAAGGLLQPYVIKDDPESLPVGKVRVLNLSPFRVGMRFNGNQEAALLPRKSKIINPVNGRCAYQLSYEGPDGWKTQGNNLIPFRSDEQTQFIILKSNNSFFQSSDGSTGRFLQTVTLRRKAS